MTAIVCTNKQNELCPCCSESYSINSVIAKDDHNEEYAIKVCDACGFSWMDNESTATSTQLIAWLYGRLVGMLTLNLDNTEQLKGILDFFNDRDITPNIVLKPGCNARTSLQVLKYFQKWLDEEVSVNLGPLVDLYNDWIDEMEEPDEQHNPDDNYVSEAVFSSSSDTMEEGLPDKVDEKTVVIDR